LLTWLSSNAAALGIFGAIVAFAWSVFQFVAVRRKEQQIHEFEAFHRLIKELVSPDPDTKATWVDRQVAAVFELRHFRRYHDVTVRILTALREQWAAASAVTAPRLLNEIDLTLDYIRRRGI
jgi:hypothetical protein